MFPAHGLNVGYNKIVLDFSSIINSYKIFIKNAVYHQFYQSAANLLSVIKSHPIIFLTVLAVIIYVILKYSLESFFIQKRKENTFALFFCGLMLFVLAIFPYAAVGKYPTVHEWLTRNALLIALPISVVLVAGVRLLGLIAVAMFDRINFGENLNLGPKLEVIFLSILVLAFSLSTVKNYFCWQARWVKDRSIIVKLIKDSNRVKQFSTFWVDDKFRIGYQRIYRFYEWSSIFKVVTGEESRVGLDQRNLAYKDFLKAVKWKRYFTKRFNLSEFEPTGRQAVLKITPGPKAGSDRQMAMTYLYYKFFSKNRLLNFLEGVAELQIKPI